MNFFISKTNLNVSCPPQYQMQSYGGYNIIFDKPQKLQRVLRHEENITVVIGYLRQADFAEPEYLRGANIVDGDLYVPEEYYGSYLIVQIQEGRIYVMSDFIGFQPLYCNGTYDILTNNYLFAKELHSDIKPDKIGFIERMIGPEFSEMGRRTMMEGFKRLLPGESLAITGQSAVSHFDNRLYSKISENYNYKDLAKSIEDETKAALMGLDEVGIALSAGYDSRLVLAALVTTKEPSKIHSYTYGTADSTETKLAKRVAEEYKIAFNFNLEEDTLVPHSSIALQQQRETNSLTVPHWLSLINKFQPKEDVMLIGDICDTISGKSLPDYGMARGDRMRSYIKGNRRNNNKPDEQTLIEGYIQKQKDRFKSDFHRIKSVLDFEYDEKAVIQAIESDIDEVFDRIKAHPGITEFNNFVDLYRSYFHGRLIMARQITVFNNVTTGLATLIGRKPMQYICNIPYNDRLYFKVFFGLFRTQYPKTTKIPTPQNPFISLRYVNTNIYMFLWGLRSLIDKFLIKRFKVRLFKQIDIKKGYELAVENRVVDSYNLSNPKMVAFLKQDFEERASGARWPIMTHTSGTFSKMLSSWEYDQLSK